MFKKTNYLNYLIFILLIMFIVLPCYTKSTSYEFCGARQLFGVDVSETVINKTERLKDFALYDFSDLWMQHQNNMLGYTGDNYQRFFIHFNKIQKSKTFPYTYLVSGKTKIKNIVNAFTGKITLLHVYEMSKSLKDSQMATYNRMLKDNDEDRVRFKENRLLVITKYLFRVRNGNIISGTACLSFYLENSKIFYDDLDLGWSDSYSNNLFVGTRYDTKTNKKERCNFGNFRIPYSGDLDYGTGNFSPSKKYFDYGWKNYVDAWDRQDKKAQKEEKKPWW